MEYDHTILLKGRYRIVAVTGESENDRDKITGYAVLTSSGARLRYELTLEDAEAWVDKLIRSEEPDRGPAAKHTQPKPASR